MSRENTHAERTKCGRFETTQWSIVLAALQTQTPEATEAMEKLCASYWYPLYAFARRGGSSPHEAEDVTQQFFAERIVTKLVFRGINPSQGKFRTWLLNSFQNFRRNQWGRQRAKKRGGGVQLVSMDLKDAEGRYLLEPCHDETPEKIFERTWAINVLEIAFARLRERYERSGKLALFDALKCYLPGVETRPSYADVATRLRKTEAGIKMAVSRLKQEYGEQVRAEIKRTVSTPAEEGEELHYLLQTLDF